GWVFDRLSAGILLPANLLAQALLLAGAGALNSTPRGFLLFSLLAGLSYGGVMVLYASAATAEWGAHRVGRVYGLLFSSNIPAAAAPAARLRPALFLQHSRRRGPRPGRLRLRPDRLLPSSLRRHRASAVRGGGPDRPPPRPQCPNCFRWCSR